MSSEEVAIKVEKISKCYQIYDKPNDRLKQFLLPRLRRLLGRKPKQYFRAFWALKDVSFEIKKGETVGIIGRNGSGKSTLLQLICGTLTPTRGKVQTNGRIAALLELGSGFNPEFSGRENIFMNAAVWGLNKEEIEACYDEIVAFADIGDFVEQPVKTYSSGMFVRLGFAIAVHVHPHTLIVDEALSVGDIAFQNKCMEKIKAIKEAGTSILFVSHDLSTVQIICDRVVWLKNGSIQQMGYPVDVCQEYYVDSTGKKGSASQIKTNQIVQHTTGLAKFSSITLFNGNGIQSMVFDVGEELRFEFIIEAEAPLVESVVAVSVYNENGDWVLGQTSREKKVYWPPVEAGAKLQGQLSLSPNCLAPGDYKVAFGAYSTDHKICYAITDLALSFSVRTNYQTWGKFIHPCTWVNQ